MTIPRCISRHMSNMKHKIVVKWLQSPYKGTFNHMNVKHVLKDKSTLALGVKVQVKLGRKTYEGEVLDLLEWKPPQKRRKRRAADSGYKASKKKKAKSSSHLQSFG